MDNADVVLASHNRILIMGKREDAVAFPYNAVFMSTSGEEVAAVTHDAPHRYKEGLFFGYVSGLCEEELRERFGTALVDVGTYATRDELEGRFEEVMQVAGNANNVPIYRRMSTAQFTQEINQAAQNLDKATINGDRRLLHATVTHVHRITEGNDYLTELADALVIMFDWDRSAILHTIEEHIKQLRRAHVLAMQGIGSEVVIYPDQFMPETNDMGDAGIFQAEQYRVDPSNLEHLVN